MKTSQKILLGSLLSCVLSSSFLYAKNQMPPQQGNEQNMNCPMAMQQMQGEKGMRMGKGMMNQKPENFGETKAQMLEHLKNKIDFDKRKVPLPE